MTNILDVTIKELQGNIYIVEVTDTVTGENIKTYDENFQTAWQAQRFVMDEVEKEFHIENYYIV